MPTHFRLSPAWFAASVALAACTATTAALKPAAQTEGSTPLVMTWDEQILAIRDTISAVQGSTRKLSGGGAAALNSAPLGTQGHGWLGLE